MQTFTATAGQDARRLAGPEDVVRSIQHMPSSPRVLPRLLEILKDDRSSLQDVVALIRLDSGMASRVLQIANSAYYANKETTTVLSMEDALHRVGLVKTYELVAFASAAQLLLRPLASYDLPPEKMWRASVTCALAAERLAARVDADATAAYTAGLLHNVGFVAIDVWLAASRQRVSLRMDRLPEESTAAEKAVLGFTNASVAAAVLRAWDFPTTIVDPVRWQYAPHYAGKHQRMAALLHCAKWTRDAVHAEDGNFPELPDAAILKTIACSEDDLTELRVEVRDSYTRANQLLAA